MAETSGRARLWLSAGLLAAALLALVLFTDPSAPRDPRDAVDAGATAAGSAPTVPVAISAPSPDRAPAPAGKVRVAVTRSCHPGPLFLASKQGLFAAEGLEVELVLRSTGERALGAMLSGAADLAVVSLFDFASHGLRGRGALVLGTVAEWTSDSVLVSRGAVDSVDALRKKRVGAQKGSAAHFRLDQILANGGLTEADVELVDLDGERLSAALTEGHIDVLVDPRPHGGDPTTRFGTGSRVVPTPGAPNPKMALAVRRRFAEESEPALASLARAILTAQDRWREDPAAGMRLVAGELPEQRRAQIEWQCEKLHFDLRLDDSVEKSLEKAGTWLQAHGAKTGDSPPIWRDRLFPSPLRSARPEVVTLTP